ncbi:STAS domain-containing protein [Streptomyces sp. NPDC012888]|uniref:STAS domain-containing protein n=1 Tax=Streptomyces sp. NPDC012888 TaxID=3364855 RepID=UPI0036828F09
MKQVPKHPPPSDGYRALGRATVDSTTEHGGLCVITPVGEFDMDSAGEVRQILAAAEGSALRRTIVDCTGVAFADSALLHVLLGARQAHHLVLAGPLPLQLSALLAHTGTAPLFTIRDSLAAARAD